MSEFYRRLLRDPFNQLLQHLHLYQPLLQLYLLLHLDRYRYRAREISSPPSSPTPSRPTLSPTNSPFPPKIVVIVFDDGRKSQLRAASILSQYGYTATFAVVTSFVNGSDPRNLSWSDLHSLAAQGFDIECHSYSHKGLNNISSRELTQEIVYSQEQLRCNGFNANLFVYPSGEGAYNETVSTLVSQHYVAARGTNIGKCNLSTVNYYDLPSYEVTNLTTIKNFACYLKGTKGNIISIIYYHEIGALGVNPANFEEQMLYLKANGYTVMNMCQLFDHRTGFGSTASGEITKLS